MRQCCGLGCLLLCVCVVDENTKRRERRERAVLVYRECSSFFVTPFSLSILLEKTKSVQFSGFSLLNLQT